MVLPLNNSLQRRMINILWQGIICFLAWNIETFDRRLECVILLQPKGAIQKAKFYKNLYINQISQINFKSFSNHRSDTVSILSSLNSSLLFFLAFLSFYTKHIFMLSFFLKSHLIRHSGMRRAFKDTQRALEHLRHSKSTRALGEHSEGTRALKALRDTDT